LRGEKQQELKIRWKLLPRILELSGLAGAKATGIKDKVKIVAEAPWN
jgi:hypothetical protein